MENGGAEIPPQEAELKARPDAGPGAWPEDEPESELQQNRHRNLDISTFHFRLWT
jgi:hypothetical protein